MKRSGSWPCQAQVEGGREVKSPEQSVRPWGCGWATALRPGTDREPPEVQATPTSLASRSVGLSPPSPLPSNFGCETGGHSGAGGELQAGSSDPHGALRGCEPGPGERERAPWKEWRGEHADAPTSDQPVASAPAHRTAEIKPGACAREAPSSTVGKRAVTEVTTVSTREAGLDGYLIEPSPGWIGCLCNTENMQRCVEQGGGSSSSSPRSSRAPHPAHPEVSFPLRVCLGASSSGLRMAGSSAPPRGHRREAHPPRRQNLVLILFY